MNSVGMWAVLALIIGVSLTLDLGVFHRRVRAISFKEAIGWVSFWVTLAILFGIGIFFNMGKEAALEFFAGYLIEESLSVDNLFVFLIIFSYFKIPPSLQHRVLFWGILMAIVMRGVFIGLGLSLMAMFSWVSYVFGAILLVTGFKTAFAGKDETAGANRIVNFCRRFMTVSDECDGDKFFTRREGKLIATPLFLTLVAVELSDVVFAVDSIPAVFAVTSDPFIVFSSNIFAVLGLRSMYFALAHLLRLVHYLNYGLGVILAFVGVKMLIHDHYEVPIGVTLGVIFGVLAVSVVLSLLFTKSKSVNET